MIFNIQLVFLVAVSSEILTRTDSFRLSKPHYQSENALTCYTCPNKGNNHDCNRWAPDKFCPSGHTMCETVHRFHHHSGRSVSVEKRCARPTKCTVDSIGCHRLHKKHHKHHLMECRSCCTDSYCNRDVPYNMTTVLELSLSMLPTDTNSATSRDSIWRITVLAAATWIIIT